MGAPAGNMTGRGAFLTLLIDGVKTPPLDVESWTLKQLAEEIQDGVNGEPRDRFDKEIKGYQLDLKMFNTSTEKLKVIIQYDLSLDSNSIPDVVVGFQLKDKKGGTTTLMLTDSLSIGAWDWASGGRTSRQMLNVPVRGQNCVVI